MFPRGMAAWVEGWLMKPMGQRDQVTRNSIINLEPYQPRPDPREQERDW